MCLCVYTCSGFLDDEFTIDPIGDTHFNGSQDNGPLSGDHWETELMGAKTTSGVCVRVSVRMRVCEYAGVVVCMCACICVGVGMYVCV